MKNWNFNGSLKENNKRVLTEAEGSVNMISARKDPSVSFNNDNGTLRMTLNIPAGGGSGGETESGVGRTYVTEDGENRGEYFNVYEGEYIGNAIGKFSHAEGGNLFRWKSSCLPHDVGERYVTIDRSRPEFKNFSSCEICIKTSIASGLNSHAEGFQTAATGDESHAEGDYSQARGEKSHAEGNNTYASGYASHAEGDNTKAGGKTSHAEGNNTEASGDNSHTEGYFTKAFGYSSHAEGYYSIADGDWSHAEGYNTIAGSDYQHVQGKYNIADYDSEYAMIIGNGTGSNNSSRANALTVDWDGNQTIAGELYIKNSSQPLIRCLTQSEYDNLATKNPYTLYLIKEE